MALVTMEAGREKARYATGIACAMNNKGEERVVNPDNIYQLAERLHRCLNFHRRRPAVSHATSP